MFPAKVLNALSVEAGVEGLNCGIAGWFVEDETREGGIVAVKLNVGLFSVGAPKVNGLTVEESAGVVADVVEATLAKDTIGAVEDETDLSNEGPLNEDKGGGQMDEIGVVVTVVVVVDDDKLALEMGMLERGGIRFCDR